MDKLTIEVNEDGDYYVARNTNSLGGTVRYSPYFATHHAAEAHRSDMLHRFKINERNLMNKSRRVSDTKLRELVNKVMPSVPPDITVEEWAEGLARDIISEKDLPPETVETMRRIDEAMADEDQDRMEREHALDGTKAIDPIKEQDELEDTLLEGVLNQADKIGQLEEELIMARDLIRSYDVLLDQYRQLFTYWEKRNADTHKN